jgi:hypothetical protein
MLENNILPSPHQEPLLRDPLEHELNPTRDDRGNFRKGLSAEYI